MNVILRIERLFRDFLDQPGLTLKEEQVLRQIPELDSVILVQVVLAMETEFGVKFSTQEVADFRTVADLVGALSRKGQTGA